MAVPILCVAPTRHGLWCMLSARMETTTADCITCYGKGEIVDDFGPSRCPDCGGAGKQLDGNTQRIEPATQVGHRPGDENLCPDTGVCTNSLCRLK